MHVFLCQLPCLALQPRSTCPFPVQYLQNPVSVKILYKTQSNLRLYLMMCKTGFSHPQPLSVHCRMKTSSSCFQLWRSWVFAVVYIGNFVIPMLGITSTCLICLQVTTAFIDLQLDYFWKRHLTLNTEHRTGFRLFYVLLLIVQIRFELSVFWWLKYTPVYMHYL